eukprot:5487688-Amphidinium_carterae.1
MPCYAGGSGFVTLVTHCYNDSIAWLQTLSKCVLQFPEVLAHPASSADGLTCVKLLEVSTNRN